MDQTKPEQNLASRAKGSKPERQDKKSKGKPAAAADAKGNADTKGMLQLIFRCLYPSSLIIPRLNRHSRGRPWTLVCGDACERKNM